MSQDKTPDTGNVLGVGNTSQISITTSNTGEKSAQILLLQQDQVYIGALNKISAYILQKLEDFDVKNAENGKLPVPLSWESIIIFFHSIISEGIHSIDLNSEERESLKKYFLVKSGESFGDTESVSKMVESIVIGIMDIFSLMIFGKSFGIDQETLKILVFINLQSGTARVNEVFTIIIDNAVNEKGIHLDPLDILEKLKNVNKQLREDFTPNSVSACPFFKSNYKKKWLEKIFKVFEDRYMQYFIGLQNDFGDNRHDFYTGRYISKI